MAAALRDDAATLAALAPGLTPEMAAAVSKLMGNQDLILVASKAGSSRASATRSACPAGWPCGLQPNHPTDDPARHRRLDPRRPAVRLRRRGHRHQPRHRQPRRLRRDCCDLIDRADPRVRNPHAILRAGPRHHARCAAIEAGEPVDLVFQSIAGTEAANTQLRRRSRAAARGPRGRAVARSAARVGDNVMYFETGQGSCLSADAHHGVDQQTCEARAYAVAREFQPLLVNTVVGFIGPEYLYDGKQIIRAGLEDHFCGKLLGLPMGCDVCYTNHAEADQDDMDTLLTLLGVAGCNYVMGVPGRGRHHAQLPIDELPRQPLPAAGAGAAARAGVRGVAASAWRSPAMAPPAARERPARARRAATCRVECECVRRVHPWSIHRPIPGIPCGV